MLGVFVAELDLDEDGERFVEGGGGGVEALGDLEGVDGVDGVEELGGRVVLLDCRGPMRWNFASVRCCEVRRISPANSWTRFSPKRRWPAAWASRMASAGCILLTAMRATSLIGAVGAAAGVGDLFVEVGEVFGDGHRCLHLIVLNLR